MGRRRVAAAFLGSVALVARVRATASGSQVTVDRPSPDVLYVAVQLEGEGTSALLFDDLEFDHVGDALTVAPRGVGATVGVERTDNVAHQTDADPTATAADYAVTIDPTGATGRRRPAASRCPATATTSSGRTRTERQGRSRCGRRHEDERRPGDCDVDRDGRHRGRLRRERDSRGEERRAGRERPVHGLQADAPLYPN